MHATYQFKPDELNEKFLQAIKNKFQNKTVEIAVTDVPSISGAIHNCDVPRLISEFNPNPAPYR